MLIWERTLLTSFSRSPFSNQGAGTLFSFTHHITPSPPSLPLSSSLATSHRGSVNFVFLSPLANSTNSLPNTPLLPLNYLHKLVTTHHRLFTLSPPASPVSNHHLNPTQPPHSNSTIPYQTQLGLPSSFNHHHPHPPSSTFPHYSPYSPSLLTLYYSTLLSLISSSNSLHSHTHSPPHILTPHPNLYPPPHSLSQIATMTNLVPDFSVFSPNYLKSCVPDPRSPPTTLTHPALDASKANYISRTLQGGFMLPSGTEENPLFKKGDTVSIQAKFYGSGTLIGDFDAVISHIQYITSRKVSDKPKNDWVPFSGSDEHATGSKSLYMVYMTVSMPSFPVDVLWIDFVRFRSSGSTSLIHPFPHETGGDALLIYTFQFPVGVHPYAMLTFGDALPNIIRGILNNLYPSESESIHKFTSSLFPFITPPIGRYMGGSRLAIFSTDIIPSSLVAAVRELPSRLPDWKGSPFITGILPKHDVKCNVSGHIPGPSSMLNPDYQTGSLATYFFSPDTLLPTIKYKLIKHISEKTFNTSISPTWYQESTYSTKFGDMHQLVFPCPKGFLPPPQRFQLINLETSDPPEDTNSTTSYTPTMVKIIFVYLRVDIPYHSHLPVAVVGGTRDHMELGECASPSSVLLSHHHGTPPHEAFYLLNTFDCVTASTFLFHPPPPIARPFDSFVPSTTLSSTSTSNAPSSFTKMLTSPPPSTPSPSLPTKGLPPASRESKGKYTTRPMPLQSPALHSEPPSKFRSTYSGPRPPTPYQDTLSSTPSPSQDPTSSLNTVLSRLSLVEARLARLETLISTTISSEVPATPLTNAFGQIGNLPSSHFLIIPTQTLPLGTLIPLVLNARKTIRSPLTPRTKWTLRPKTSTPGITPSNLALQIPRTSPELPELVLLHAMLDPKLIINYLAISFLPTTHFPHYSPRIHLTTQQSQPQYPPLHTVSITSNSVHTSNPPFTPSLSPPTSQHVIIHFPSISFHLRGPFHPNPSIKSLLTLLPPTLTPLHPNPLRNPNLIFRLTYNGSTINLDSPLTSFPNDILDFFVHLPIIGGTPTTTITSTKPLKIRRGPNLRKPLTLSHFNIRVATLNCNGSFNNSDKSRHQLLWDFVATNHIDVLFLIDHRGSSRTLEHAREHGSRHLNTDIRLINHDTTLFSTHRSGKTPLTTFHASVGGCAILTFGSLAHITFPSKFIDPSGASSFIGAKIVPHSSLPPIFLNAVYLFPASTGPTTLHTRIHLYLRDSNSSLSPCTWQQSTIATLLTQQRDDHPNCTQILGGDFNHRHWDDLEHPITSTFINELLFSNPAHTATILDPSITPPITFPRSSSWIDHFLHYGRSDVTDFCAYNDTLLYTYSDHVPYSNDITIYIPSQHHHIPNNLHLQAQSRLKATHLRKHDTLSIARFTAMCTKHSRKFTPPPEDAPPSSHESFYDTTCSLLVKFAKSATKYTIKPSLPKRTRWSPSIAFLYKFITFLLKLRSNPTSVPYDTLHSRISQFLHKQYSATILVDNSPTFRYHDIIHSIFPSYPSTPLPPFTSLPHAITFIDSTLQLCRTNCHAKHQLTLRQNINSAIARNETLRKEGRLKNVIRWILERDSSPRFSTVVTAKNITKPIPKAAHRATLLHFTNHFSSHEWIQQSHINSTSPEGHLLRQSLLTGTWRSHFPHLSDSLPPRSQQYAYAYFDNFRYKASPAQKQDLLSLTSLPITFQAFHSAITKRNGNKSPGPSGLTLSILHATPLPILQNLHQSLHAMWEAKHIPASWQTREMALLPKNLTALPSLKCAP